MKRIAQQVGTPGTVIAFVALIIAMTGTAAALQGQNTVRSDDIVNGQVKAKDLAASLRFVKQDYPVNLGNGSFSPALTATCPAGARAISGGIETSPADTNVSFTHPEGSPPTQWEAGIQVISGGPVTTISVWAICSKAIKTSGP